MERFRAESGPWKQKVMLVIPGDNIVGVETEVIRDNLQLVWITTRLYVQNMRATHHSGINLTEFSPSQAVSGSQS